MPKTFTDDVAAALPSSIEGPFQVVDPADHDRFIKIDPAGARVEAGGGAGRKRIISRLYSRSSGLLFSGTIGSALVSRRAAAGTTAGMFLTPFAIPPDVDGGAASSVKVTLAPFEDATTNGQVIRFSVVATRWRPGEAASDFTVDFDWAVPDDWTADDPREVVVDNGNGATFEGGTWAAGDQVGLLFQRSGGASEDTFDKDIVFPESCVFEYTAKEF